MFDKWSEIAISKIKNGDSLKECDPDAKRSSRCKYLPALTDSDVFL